MTRIDELQKKYPRLLRDIIVKFEALNRGIRHSDGLDKVSNWERPEGRTYQSYDHDVSLKEAVEESTGNNRPGFMKRPPDQFYTKNGVGVMVQRDSSSPYEVRELRSGQFALCEGDEKVEDIYFLRRKSEKEELVTAKGRPVSTLVCQRRVCFSISPVRHCEYFTLGEQCKFCNFNATQEAVRSLGFDNTPTINLQDTLEAYRLISSNTTLVEGRFAMGGFRSSEKESRIHLRFIETIASATSRKPNLSLATRAMDRKAMQRAKDSGLDSVMFQMEVWDPQLFAEICPGKAKYLGYDRYKEAFLEAVGVFGGGNVTAVFVGGVTLMPPNGHETWQESRDSLIEGNHWMIENDVLPMFLNLRLGPGSVYGDDKSNRSKLPPTEYYLDAVEAHHEAMAEYGLYQKMNKLMACPMCLDHNYHGEVGMLESAGNMGNWLAETIPDEANWLARFVSSLGSPVDSSSAEYIEPEVVS